MTKPPILHTDLLGRNISLGDYVAFPDSNTLKIGVVDKINPKMLRLIPRGRKWTVNKYPHDVVRLEGPDLTVFLLKN